MRAITFGNLRWGVFFLRFCSIAMLCVVKTRVMRLPVIEGPKARIEAFYSLNPLLFILSGSPNECWLHTCRACVITTWRLGLRAPLVARLNGMKECIRQFIINRFLLQNLVNCASHVLSAFKWSTYPSDPLVLLWEVVVLPSIFKKCKLSFQRARTTNKYIFASIHQNNQEVVSGLQFVNDVDNARRKLLILTRYELNVLACSQCMGLHSSNGRTCTAALTQMPWVWIRLKSRNFFQVYLYLLKLQLPLRRSYRHLKFKITLVIISNLILFGPGLLKTFRLAKSNKHFKEVLGIRAAVILYHSKIKLGKLNKTTWPEWRRCEQN